MIFSTLEHILTHISFSMVSVVITLQLITLSANEICNNRAKCYFDPRVCYFGSLNENASIRNISTRPPISVVNDACKYDGLGSLLSIALLIITFQKDIKKDTIRIFDKRKLLLNESFFSGEIQYMNEKGVVWANEAWGSYWNWDPKETWAFITWTIFTIYLHIRTNKNLQSTDSVIVAFIGFLIIWICYFGVNLL
ncbi:hypothetical protein Cgig2_032235 [Carnegiea gigantea]|uniref:Cytochrome c assembly protein domain-containing protein n=1 Tax=Carnegiea gigantea TaxID=171969 RepID=A0A9Q1JN18_9CARY|nr:hypothetical protein Cgig2_032235 [Carnegiea gigantea]